MTSWSRLLGATIMIYIPSIHGSSYTPVANTINTKPQGTFQVQVLQVHAEIV